LTTESSNYPYYSDVGGYRFQGADYPDTISLNETLERISRVYAVEYIYEDNWNYNFGVAGGQIGLGPDSPFMIRYINPTSLQSEYSILM